MVMAATVIEGTPPSSADSSMPMAVVTDLGSRVTYCSWDNAEQQTHTQNGERAGEHAAENAKQYSGLASFF